jgi:hypothetical protein
MVGQVGQVGQGGHVGQNIHTVVSTRLTAVLSALNRQEIASF